MYVHLTALGLEALMLRAPMPYGPALWSLEPFQRDDHHNNQIGKGKM